MILAPKRQCINSKPSSNFDKTQSPGPAFDWKSLKLLTQIGNIIGNSWEDLTSGELVTRFRGLTCSRVISRGYYTVERRYEFYIRVAKAMSHE